MILHEKFEACFEKRAIFYQNIRRKIQEMTEDKLLAADQKLYEKGQLHL